MMSGFGFNSDWQKSEMFPMSGQSTVREKFVQIAELTRLKPTKTLDNIRWPFKPIIKQ